MRYQSVAAVQLLLLFWITKPVQTFFNTPCSPRTAFALQLNACEPAQLLHLETQIISSWKETIRIIRSNSLLLTGLPKNKLNDQECHPDTPELCQACCCDWFSAEAIQRLSTVSSKSPCCKQKDSETWLVGAHWKERKAAVTGHRTHTVL